MFPFYYTRDDTYSYSERRLFTQIALEKKIEEMRFWKIMKKKKEEEEKLEYIYMILFN
jgi:hypothetical protein